MSKEKQHQWETFYSPRNGRINIQACCKCGVAQSFVIEGSKCQEVSEQTKNARLRGWTTDNSSYIMRSQLVSC